MHLLYDYQLLIDIHAAELIHKPGSKKYKLSGGTAKPAQHLRNHHSKKLDLRTSSSPIITGMKIAAEKFDQQQFCQQVGDDLLLLWIFHWNIPFSMTSDNRFQALMQYLNHANRNPWSPITAKVHIIARFGQLKPQVADLMKQATTQIHLSCDGWTSPHQTMAVIGVIAHFTS
jgi:hypothetical protein